MDKDKKYGNISLGTLRYLVDSLNKLEILKKEFTALYQDVPQEKKNELLGSDFSWVRLYKYSFYKNLRAFIFVAGFRSIFRKIIKRKPPNMAEEIINEFEKVTEFTGGPFGLFKEKYLIETLLPIIKNVDAIALYGTTVNKLIKHAEKGNDLAFFKAVRIDRSVITYKNMTPRIAKAELEGDEKFFKDLRNALTAKVGKLIDYAVLRYILAALHEAKALETLTQKEAYELLVTELRLYPQTGEDPERSLWQFISRWKVDVDFDIQK